MRRALSIFAAVSTNKCAKMSENGKLISNFKDWKFRSPPNYSKLPIDDNPEYNVPVAVKNAVFSMVPTEPLTGKLHLVCASDDALTDILDLSPAVADTEEFINFVAGRYLPGGGLSVSHRYGGHQFGFWADQLGDGRAHVLGEYINSKGESWQPQLKGCGETPYSRFGDGRAVLRSSIREMVASEACHYLGIPTTRAAALVVSEDHKVYRDKTYSGQARQERCAVLVRLAHAWYRLGSFEILNKRSEPQTMTTLADFIIEHHFPSIDPGDDDRYVKWYSEVAFKNLDMVATWQGLGFTHGVLNTDNVSVLGVTIDYGPYGFMDHYTPHHVPNTSDDMGRYAFNRQPSIMIWNLMKFAEAIDPILTEEQRENVQGIIGTFESYINIRILQTYITKLGLLEIKDGDDTLIQDLLRLMEHTTADFTATFRQLAETDLDKLTDKSALEELWSLKKLCDSDKWGEWVARYKNRLLKENG